MHTFKFIYTKNAGNSSGSDCAWLDFIVLPLPQYTTAFAGMDNYSCQDLPYPCSGNAANYSTVSWATAGTGTFSDASILNPVYTPGAADITAGSVILSMTANGYTGTVIDTMVLTIQKPSTSAAGENAAICSGLTHITNGASATNYAQVNWTSNGTGIFTDPSVMNAEYTPGTADITAGMVTLTMTASNQSCLAAVSSKTLTINTTPAPQVSGENVVCAQTTGMVYSTPVNAGNTYAWTITGGTIASGSGTNQISVNWGSDATGTLSVAENTAHNCQASQNSTVVINPIPSTLVAGNSIGCMGDNTAYSATAVTGNSYNWNITGGTITSGQGTNEVQVSWTNAGANTISVSETINTTLCSVTKTQDVTINNTVAAPAKPQGAADVDLNALGNSDYTIPATAFATSYVWQLMPAEAGIVSGSTTNANVVWNSSYRGNATLTAKAVNNCGESAESEVFTVRVYSSLGISDDAGAIGLSISPNPNKGNFVLTVQTPGKNLLDLRITAANGAVVFEQTGIESNGKYSEALTLNLAPGTYNITVKTMEGFVVKKFVVTK
jgi:hypothetical protein